VVKTILYKRTIALGTSIDFRKDLVTGPGVESVIVSCVVTGMLRRVQDPARKLVVSCLCSGHQAFLCAVPEHWRSHEKYQVTFPSLLQNRIFYYLCYYLLLFCSLQCFDAVGWVAGRASGGGVLVWMSVWSKVSTCIWPS